MKICEQLGNLHKVMMCKWSLDMSMPIQKEKKSLRRQSQYFCFGETVLRRYSTHHRTLRTSQCFLKHPMTSNKHEITWYLSSYPTVRYFGYLTIQLAYILLLYIIWILLTATSWQMIAILNTKITTQFVKNIQDVYDDDDVRHLYVIGF